MQWDRVWPKKEVKVIDGWTETFAYIPRWCHDVEKWVWRETVYNKWFNNNGIDPFLIYHKHPMMPSKEKLK